jgi:hypothetical protein
MAFTELSTILAGMFIVAAIGFIILAQKFFRLRNVVYVSIKDMGELIVLLALYEKVENPEQKIARMLKMTPDEVKREIDQGRIMILIGRKANDVLENMKNSVPEVKHLLEPLEHDFTS